MGQAKRRGTFEQRLALALEKKAVLGLTTILKPVEAVKPTKSEHRRMVNSPLIVTALASVLCKQNQR